MENIAAVRPDMAVLDKNKLMLSPFGALSHALAEEILARTGQAEGVYPFVPLELLNEPEAEPEAKAEEPTVNVEVKLTLEFTQEARELRERTETVERILERIERIRERSEVVQRPQSRERETAQPAESRSFFQNINQHISFPMTLSVPDAEGTAQPGGIARISEKFVNTLTTMREEGIYQEPGGETQRVADVGWGDAKIAGSEAAGSGAASGEVGRAAVDRTLTSGRTDLSGADFAVRAAETELNTSGVNERSPETAARAAERIGEKIAESAAREIAEKFDELAKREAQAGSGAVTGRDGGARAATRDVDNERGQGVRDNDQGQGAHGDMETGRPSRTRRREAQNRGNPEITEGADGEKAYAALTGMQDRTGEGTDESGGTSPESRREAAGIEREERPTTAVPVINEDRPLAPEELTLAADTRPERSGEEPFRAGRETGEDTRHVYAKEGRAKREHENGAVPRRAGNNRAQGEADEDTADTAGGTGTVEMAEGRTVAGETEKPGISQNAGEKGTVSRSEHGQEGVDSEAPEVAAVSREELTEELPHRARGVAARESEERGADEGYRTGAEAIPLRGESEMPAPEELTLSSAAERSGEVSPTVGRQTTIDGGRADDRAKSTVESDGKNLTHMTGAAGVDMTAGEATVRGADRAGHGTGSSESDRDTVRMETVPETGPVREAGKAGEFKTAERNAPKVGTAEGGEAGRAERAFEAVPDHGKPYMPAPEELVFRKEETAAPEDVTGTRTGGEDQDTGETRDVRKARDAGVTRVAGEAYGVGGALDAVEGREVRKARDAVESYDTGVAEAIPLRGELVEVTPEELALAQSEETAKPDGGRTGDTVHDAAADEQRDTHPHGGETVHIDGKTGRPGRASAAISEDGGEETDGTGRTSEKTGRAGKAGELRDAEGETARVGTVEAGEAGLAERPVEAIPDHGKPYVPAPEELALWNGETATPEDGAQNVNEAQNEVEGRKVRGARDANESYDVREARNARETHDAVKGRDVREARGAGVVYDAGTAHNTGAAEAIPLRGKYAEVTPEELTLARAEDAARLDGGRTGDTVRGAVAGEKRDIHPHSGETVHIDGKTGRPERTAAAIGEDGGEETGGTGRISEKTDRAGKAGELRTAEGEAARVGTVEAGEAGRVERAVEAIPERERPYMPAPEELVLRNEETAAPEGGAILSPGSTAKSVEALAKGIAEKALRAERAGIRAGDGTDNVAGREARRARRTAERASVGNAVAGPAPVELAYGGTGDARADEQSRTQPAGNIAESEYVKSLPDWARRFLKEGAGSLGTAGSMAVTSIPDTGKAQNKKPQMMEWTAPGYQPTPPAETQFKEMRPPEDTGTQAGEVQISDAEIRRTADRVYKMIEDRIRRERRRLGL